VLSPAGGRAVIAAWSERVRFSARRGGYHGGASPQEVLIPIAVLSAGTAPNGWAEAPPVEPPWWRGEDAVPLSAPEAGTPSSPRRRERELRQGELFTGESRPEAAVALSWLSTLLGSETYATQRRLAGRAAPTDALVRRLVTALALRGGRMTRAGLSQSLEIPMFRLGGFVSATRRVLNVDQAQILRDDGDDIVLDVALLRAQFALGGEQ
jgi:hypothetical protein